MEYLLRFVIIVFLCTVPCDSFEPPCVSFRVRTGASSPLVGTVEWSRPTSTTSSPATVACGHLSSRDEASGTSELSVMVDRSISLIGKTTSIAVAGGFFAMLAWKRDALMVSFFIGAISNGILSKVLKKLFNQNRPPGRRMQDDSWLSVEPSDGGMPSSHAMSLGFIGTFTCRCLPQLLVPVLAYVLVSLIYRVHSKLHTSQQVIAGLFAGTCNGFLWWRLCHGKLIPGLNVLNLVSQHFLVNGVLPWPYLIIPAALGLAVVGSFERRIGRWLKKAKGS